MRQHLPSKKVLALFLVAFALRLLHLAAIRDTPYFDTLVLDAYEYDTLSSRLLEGNWLLLNESGYVHGPLYPYLLALLKLFGAGPVGIRIFQALLDAISCILLYRVAAAFFATQVALIAGLCAAFYWPFIFFSGELLATPVVLVLELALVLVLLRCQKRPSTANGALAGLNLGLLVLTRSNTVLLLPMAGWLLYRVGTSRRDVLPAFVATFALVVAPFIVRNYVVQGTPLPFQGGWSFYMGNNPDADGTPYARQGIVWQRLELLPVEAGATTAAEKGDFYVREGLRYIGSDPGAYLHLLYRKFRLFWHAYEIPVSADMRYLEAHSWLYPFLVLHFGLLGPFALAGMLWNVSRFHRYLPLYGFVLVYLLNGLLFSVCSRYRLPALPFLLVFAAGGVWQLKELLTVKRLAQAGVFLLSVAASALLVHTGVDVNRVDHLRSAWLQGQVYIRQQQYDLAEEALLIGARVHPDDPDIHNSLAVVYEYQLRPTEAAAAYREALQHAPDHARALLNLGKLYLSQQRFDEAVATLQEALRHDPRGNSRYEANYHLGHAYLQRQDYERAFQSFRDALRAHESAPAYYGLSAVYARLRRSHDQMQALEKAVEIDSTFAAGYRNLGVLYFQQGRLEAAEKAFRRALHHDPSSGIAHQHLGRLYQIQGQQERAGRHLERATQLQQSAGTPSP